MEQTTSMFTVTVKTVPMNYREAQPDDTSYALRCLRSLEEFPWYRDSAKTTAERVACVSILMQIWARSIVSRQYAARVAVQLLKDVGIIFNREPIYEDLEPLAHRLASPSVMKDYSKFTLMTQDYQALAQEVLHRTSVRMDMV